MEHRDQHATVVVADVGATFVRVALWRAGRLGPIAGRPVTALEREGDRGITASLARLLEETGAAGWDGPKADALAASKPVAIGIGICAAIDDRGAVQKPLDFGVPAGTILPDGIRDATGLPVAIDNDANMAALGELHHGAGRGLDDFLMITLGTNIGMGIVTRGRVYRGSYGAAGEGGLMLVPVRTVEGARDAAGRRPVFSDRFGSSRSRAPEGYAWIEELVGGGALASAWAREQAQAMAAHVVRAEVRAPVRVLREAAAGDGVAASIVERAIEGWALAIANLVAFFDPGAIVLAGGLTDDLGPYLDHLSERATALSRARPRILVAELGAVGGLVGAGVAALAAARER